MARSDAASSRKRAALITALSILAVMGIVAAAVFTTSDRPEPTYYHAHRGPPPAGGLYLILDIGYWMGTPIRELARKADLVVTATVAKELSPYWSTGDRKRPQFSEERIRMRGYPRIYTPYELHVEEVLYGEAPADGKIIINKLGGQIGKDIVMREFDRSLFSFTPGTRVVVFLRDCGEKRAKRLGSTGARYRIIDRIVLDEDGQPNYKGISYDDLAETVEREGPLETTWSPVSCSGSGH